MAEKLAVLEIAEQLLNDSEESEQDFDSSIEEEYREDELFLSVLIQQRKRTLSELLHNSVGTSHSQSSQSESDDHKVPNHHHNHRSIQSGSRSQKTRKRKKVYEQNCLENVHVSKCNSTETNLELESNLEAQETVGPDPDVSPHSGATHIARVGRYSEEVARAMDDSAFKTHFGMTRATFQVVRYHLLGRVPEKYVDLDTQLMCTLWMLGTQDSYRTTAERFMLSKGTVHFIVMRLCTELAALSDIFIRWPSEDQYHSVAANFEGKTGFPGVVGCVDHMCVKIRNTSSCARPNIKPCVHMQVQGVCDFGTKFTFLRLWQQGCLYNMHHNSELVRLTRSFTNQYHLLGDSKYPQDVGLLTPYNQSGEHLSEWQKKYDDVHRWTRLQAEYAFAQLKVRFWRLKWLDMSLKDKVRDVVVACCVLHNIVVEHEGPLDMTYEEIIDVLGKSSHGSAPSQRHGISDADSKREQIARQLC